MTTLEILWVLSLPVAVLLFLMLAGRGSLRGVAGVSIAVALLGLLGAGAKANHLNLTAGECSGIILSTRLSQTCAEGFATTGKKHIKVAIGIVVQPIYISVVRARETDDRLG